jgi:hypothetical protein
VRWRRASCTGAGTWLAIRAAPSIGHRPPCAVRRAVTSTPWRGVAIGAAVERASRTTAGVFRQCFLTSALTIRAAVERASPGSRDPATASSRCGGRRGAGPAPAGALARGELAMRSSSRETARSEPAATSSPRRRSACPAGVACLAASAASSPACACVRGLATPWPDIAVAVPTPSRPARSLCAARHTRGRAILVRPTSRTRRHLTAWIDDCRSSLLSMRSVEPGSWVRSSCGGEPRDGKIAADRNAPGRTRAVARPLGG